MNRFQGVRGILDRMGDGQYGVFVANYGGPMKLFELSAEGRLLDNAPTANMALTTGGRSLVVLPGPMGLDVFAGNENGANFFFEALGEGRYVERAAAYGIDDPRETVRGVTILDANGDGLLDLLYGNWEGPHRLFLRNQDRTFTNAMSEVQPDPPVFGA